MIRQVIGVAALLLVAGPLMAGELDREFAGKVDKPTVTVPEAVAQAAAKAGELDDESPTQARRRGYGWGGWGYGGWGRGWGGWGYGGWGRGFGYGWGGYGHGWRGYYPRYSFSLSLGYGGLGYGGYGGYGWYGGWRRPWYGYGGFYQPYSYSYYPAYAYCW
jgi:hypothetical protein